MSQKTEVNRASVLIKQVALNTKKLQSQFKIYGFCEKKRIEASIRMLSEFNELVGVNS